MTKSIFLLSFLALSLVGLSQPKSFDVFDKSEYAERRARFMEKIPGGIAVINGAAERSDYYRFFQNNDFMYLCGLEIPDAVLVIDAVNNESTIFFSATERAARGHGIPLDHITNTCEVTGLDKQEGMEKLEDFLKDKANISTKFYTGFSPEELMRECTLEKKRANDRHITNNPRDGRPSREQQFVSYLKDILPGSVEISTCSNMIWDMRLIKTPAEIDLLRKAGKIAVEAHKEMIKATYAGQQEYELASIFEHANKKRGAQDLAYYTIICASENHPHLHYHTYDRALKDGDFLVIDGGPDYHYYDIDISVSYPVNGKFTPRQKEIYEACNAMHEACMAVYRPGLSSKDLPKEVEAELIKMGYDPSLPIFKRFRASFGHSVGMAVHDVGSRISVLKEGMVFANEPLAVFMEENLGVRVEDTILITADGCENLTEGIPRTVEEIEAFMKK